MPLDIHARITAWLHIVVGVLGACVIGVIGVLAGVFGAIVGSGVQGHDASILGVFAGLGVLVFVIVMAFPVLEIVGGAMLLNGSPAGRVLTIIFSVIGLINIPIGTAIGIYSLWALLREVPRPIAGTMVAEPAVRPY